MTKSKEATIVKERFKKAVELSQDAFDRVEVNRNLYKNQMNADQTYEWDYSLVDPHIFPLIRNYIARTNPSFTKVRLEHRKAEDLEKRQINQDFVNWELGEMDIATLLTKLYFSAFITGKGYLKTGWRYEKGVNVSTPEGDIKVMRTITNRAEAKFVRFNDLIIPNRNITVLDEQPYIFELIQKRVGEMLDENETYGQEYWDKSWIAELKKSGVEKNLLDYQADFVEDSDTSKSDMAFKSAYVALICMHSKDGEVLYIPYKGEEKIVNKVRTNPYWHGHYPFMDFTVFPEDDEFYSMSVVDAVADLQIAASEILNQTLTNIRKINNNMWIAGSSAANTPDWQFSSRPDGIIRVSGDAAQIQQVKTADTTRSALAMTQELQNKIERTGGISSLYSSGSAGSKVNQTARGAQIIDQNIDTNVQMIYDLFGEQILKKLGEHFLELNAQFVTEEQSFHVTGKKNVRDIIAITPEQVTANFDVYVNSERMQKQTPASRQASLQNLIQVISSQASIAGVVTDMTPLFEALIDSHPDTENIDPIISSIDEKSQNDIAYLERKQMPEIKIRDAHQELISAATVHFQSNVQRYDPEVVTMFQQYMDTHLRYLQAEAEIKMLTAPPQIPGMPGQGGGALKPGGDGTMPETAGLPEQGGVKTYNLGSLIK